MLLAAGAASAQRAADAPRADAQTAQELPAVTVSEQAEKTGSAEDGYLVQKITGAGIWGERDVQDTPYSITVMPQELIENANAKDMDQLFRMNPATQETGRIASDSTDGAWVNIRGFRVTNPVVNGIPYGSRVGGTPMMQDMERVEVVHGATGFLYGGGRVGGAVNYVTKKPTLEPLRALNLGSYGGSTHFSHLDLGGQIDKGRVFGYRINALHQDGESSRKEKKTIDALSLVLDVKPSENFRSDVRLAWKDSENPGPSIFWSGNNSEPIDYSRAGIRRNQSFTPPWQKHKFQSKKIENNIHWSITDILTLRSGLFYEKIHRSGGDARFRYVDGIVQRRSWFGNPSRGENNKLGLAAYLDSRFDTAGVAHVLTMGYSLTQEKAKSSQGGSSFNIADDTTLDGFRNFPRPAGFGSLVGAPTPNAKDRMHNILLGDDIRFNEQWSVLVGGNQSTIYRKSLRTGVVSYDHSAFTPTLSLIYKPLERWNIYTTYIESLEQGGTVPDDPKYRNATEVLAPYISKQYEIGSKYRLNILGREALLGTSLFRIEKSNVFDEEDTSLPANAPGRITRTRDGLQVNQGLELVLSGKLGPAWSLMAGGTLLDLKVKKNTNPALNGKKPSGSASKMLKAYAEYRLPGVDGLTLSAGAYYTGKKYNDNANQVVVPAYTLVDVGARYATTLGGRPATWNLTIQNLADTVYWSNTSTLGDPRTVSLTLRMHF